ncbi:hypothetical protein LOTGIDRAFT_226173 [Lottia gigantea]|uniref:Sulfotransferase domain-containing protein n=1 Tax=Lottia gigantea TaxID=225164 RepID=V4AR08_LOTGI|nr:hypothetical protein LOTGIDRAFT_226173 [Lottia gigantea]ESO99682.1 hypothetical protein LOTGIDRAFT_226173 [Lottia gigantea]
MQNKDDHTEEERPYIVQDAGGDTLSLKKINDRILINAVSKAKWDGLKAVEGKKDDVLVTCYAKSGSHYVYEIVSMLQKGNSEPIPNVMELNHMDFLSVEKVAEILSPRTMCTHRYFDELPVDMIHKKCKLVQVVRNPKDACVSYFHHLIKTKSVSYDGKFPNFIPIYMKGEVPFGGWDGHFLKWKESKLSNPDYPILTIRYEDLVANPVKGIKKLATFIGKEYSDKLYEEIAVNTHFDQMKTYKESLHNPSLPHFKGEKEIMYRKGKTGDWKNHFLPSEAEEFDNYYRDKLEERDYIYLNDS